MLLFRDCLALFMSGSNSPEHMLYFSIIPVILLPVLAVTRVRYEVSHTSTSAEIESRFRFDVILLQRGGIDEVIYFKPVQYQLNKERIPSKSEKLSHLSYICLLAQQILSFRFCHQ